MTDYKYAVFYRRLPVTRGPDDVMDATHFCTSKSVFETELDPYVQLVACAIMSRRGVDGDALVTFNDLARLLGMKVPRNARHDRTERIRSAVIYLLTEHPVKKWGWSFTLSESSKLQMQEDGYTTVERWLERLRGSYTFSICPFIAYDTESQKEEDVRFALVPFRRMHWIMSQLNNETLLRTYMPLSIFLSAFHGKSGHMACATSVSKLCGMVGLSEKTVGAAIENMVKSGIFVSDHLLLKNKNGQTFTLTVLGETINDTRAFKATYLRENNYAV